MDFHTIKFEEPEAGVGLLTLNWPERLNALSLEMIEELRNSFHNWSGLKKRMPEIPSLGGNANGVYSDSI